MLEFNMQSELYLNTIEAALSNYCSSLFSTDSEVTNAVRYSLLNGGKRVRGVLTLAVCEMLCGDYFRAIPYACAVEMVHSYSLIHDDLPCMDNDDMRRGKPSCHKAFGEATALLAGDALLTAAFEAICDNKETAASAVTLLSKMAGARGMVYGQELDLRYENKKIDENQLYEIHKNKTGMLINAAVSLGAIAAKAQKEQQDTLTEYAYALGLVFQIVDDMLDVTSSEEELGKPIGSDGNNNKFTFVALKGIDGSQLIANELTDKACSALKGFANFDYLLAYTNMLLSRRN